MDWDNLRIFLALANEGSVRSAGAVLGISHSTVARRIDAFEDQLGVRLFDRTPGGYAPTAAGEEMLGAAARIEEDVNTLERKILGQDTRLAGEIRITLPDAIVSELLMPDLATFTRNYPDIDLEIILSYRQLDLSRREADIAIRFLPTETQPPEHLVGRRLVVSRSTAYAEKGYLATVDISTDPTEARWLGWDDRVRSPKWVRDSDQPHLPARGRFYDTQLQLQAAKQGLGLAMLPCFVGDREADLVRVPPGNLQSYRDVWILSHPDLRETARLRVFREFIIKAILKHRSLIEGGCPRTTT
jgi:DNA-binding transcriptional LysR family regulator